MKPGKHRGGIKDVLGRDPAHPFPARMAPGIALGFLDTLPRRARILDPMMGSGTVVALARANGHRAIGIDIDPLAVLIATAWTTPVSSKKVRKHAVAVLERARSRFPTISKGDAYPRNSDKQTKKFVRYWFDDYARRQLVALAGEIAAVRDKKVRNILWCAFSRLIITKQSGVSLAMDLAHSRPHKVYERAPIKPFNAFLGAIEKVLKGCLEEKAHKRGPKAMIKLGDARKLHLSKNSIDLVLTSPPYLNAIDYMRCSKFSLVWMGYRVGELSEIRSDSIGSEVGQMEGSLQASKLIHSLKLGRRLSARHQAVLLRFVEDMRNAINEAARVLAPGGQAVFVLGENTVRGTYIPNSKIVAALASDVGLRFRRRHSRALPQNRRYLPPPRARKRTRRLDIRMRREVILVFGKPKLPQRRLKK